jgi:hypothetical protein
MTIVASWGGQYDNAYADLTSVNSYLTTAVVDFAAWTNATSQQQTAAIIQAARDIDSQVYIGGRYYYDQHLEFPRTLNVRFPWNRTVNSSNVDSVEQARMKQAVEEATAQQALWILRKAGLSLDASRIASGISEIEEHVGPISKRVKYDRNVGSVTNSNKLSPEAASLLAPYRTSRRAYRA